MLLPPYVGRSLGLDLLGLSGRGRRVPQEGAQAFGVGFDEQAQLRQDGEPHIFRSNG